MTTSTLKTVAEIIADIESYIRNNGGVYKGWYAGVASDPRTRLFNDHSVNEKGDAWIFRDCGTDTAARKVEDYFLAKGCDGDTGGGDRSTKYVYAYKANAHTRR